jgi:hypothetical protein
MTGNFLAAMIGGIILLAGSDALAGMDYRCLATCQQHGLQHQYCVARCTVQTPRKSDDPAFPDRHGTDYRCVDKCAGTGRPRQYCVKNCSY